MPAKTSPSKAPKATKTGKNGLPARRNPYQAITKTKASATYQLFREAWLQTTENLDEEGMDKLIKKYGFSTTWVYIAVRAISEAAAQIPLSVVKERRDGEPNIQVQGYDKGLIRLLKQPNPYERRFDFLEAIFTCLELTGNCFIEKVKDDTGKTIEMYVLNPSRVTILPDPKKKIRAYVYEVNGRWIAYPPDEIIHIKYYHPANEYYGLAPLTAARLPVDMDKSAMEWNQNFLLRGAWPVGALESEHDIDEDEYKRLNKMIKQTMQQGKDAAGRLMLLTGGLKFNKIGLTPKDGDWLDTRRMSRDEILAIFKVPFAVAGLFSTEQTTARSSGVEQQIKNFYRNTIFPKIEKVTAALNRSLVPEFRDSFEIIPNYRSVPALQEEVTQELTRAQALYQLTQAGVSLNQAMGRLYPDFSPEPWGDVRWVNVQMVPVDGPDNPYTEKPALPPPEQSPPPEKALERMGEAWERIRNRVKSLAN